ncbi:MAG: methyltransferase domain-containing protein [Deltaproteobacteria bacterium]|nr:methyltransferase domain-containing protein [Deltaproteobacteria bacterium]
MSSACDESEVRREAGDLARESLAQGDATGWFETLYRRADGDAGGIPWADLAPNPNLTAWLDREHVAGGGRRALKVGCGLGDDAEELARRGFSVTAFDVSPTAVAWCRRRFPGSVVRWTVADVLTPPRAWDAAFDVVLESYTLQVLPPAARARAIANLARFVAPGGELLVIARGRDAGDPAGVMPWPLLRRELDAFRRLGLSELAFEDFLDAETPPVRRFRARYRNVRAAARALTGRARARS